MLLYKNISMQFIIVLISIIIFSQISNADTGKETGLEIPRYISLKSNDANIRVGPSKNYPIKIKYIKKNYNNSINQITDFLFNLVSKKTNN